MGHRCLIAYESDDGTYNVHYSHWGGHAELPLKAAISEGSPLGGASKEPAFVNDFLAMLEDGFDGEVSGKLTEAQSSTEVEPEPKATGVSLREATHEMLDFLHHEAFYVVDADFNVRAFRTWRLNPPEDGEPFERDVGNGVLVEASFGEDGKPEHLSGYEGRFRGAKMAADTMMECGGVSREAANEWLVNVARTLVDQHSGMDIPPFSPNGHPAKNCRKGGFATSAIPANLD